MDKKLTVEQARSDINVGCQQLVINALVNDLAAARVRIAELEADCLALKSTAEEFMSAVEKKAKLGEL